MENIENLKFSDYVKVCDELNLERSELGFFVFEIFWTAVFANTDVFDNSLVYEKVKDMYLKELNNEVNMKKNKELFEQKKKLEESEEFYFSFCEQERDEVISEDDNYDLQYGPIRGRNR